MGCDIHLEVHANRGGTWEKVSPPSDLEWHDEYDRKYKRWYSDRCYDAFGILADVRNGRGFAGIVTGESFIPVVPERRGLPSDLPADAEDDYRFGDHSFHWLTLRELVDYPHWGKTRVSIGIVPSKLYVEKFKDKPSRVDDGPTEYCSGISGPGVRVLGEAEFLAIGAPVDDRTHVNMQWGETYGYSASRLYSHLLPSLKVWADANELSYDQVRLVFGFDS